MPAIAFPINGCEYVTDDVDAAVAAALLMVHNNVDVNAPRQVVPKQRAPKNYSLPDGVCSNIEPPLLPPRYANNYSVAAMRSLPMIYCGRTMTFSNQLSKFFMHTIKKLAVTPVAVSVCRSDLPALRQADGENIRSFHARIKGKAATCAYLIDCSSATCTQMVDFTDVIIKDVLISGLSDEEVKMEVFGWHDLDRKTVDQTVQFIEAKEMV